MVRISEVRQKEIINISDGCRMGYIGDLEVDLETGSILSVIVPGPARVFGMFGRDQEYKIPWCKIKQIGDDIILVDLDTSKALSDYE